MAIGGWQRGTGAIGRDTGGWVCGLWGAVLARLARVGEISGVRASSCTSCFLLLFEALPAGGFGPQVGRCRDGIG